MWKLAAITILAVGAFVLGVNSSSLLTPDAQAPAQPNTKTRAAKNVILFIGDGMGVSTVTAARIFDGQSRGLAGEENSLSFERFPHVALVKTYNTNQQVPDSAGTATAIHTGRKTRAGLIGIGPQARRQNCVEAQANKLATMGELVKTHRKALGVVTTTRVTHATPATVYAHSADRLWESDRFMPQEALESGCVDIARQLIEFDVGGGFDIVLGGGTQEFYGSRFGGQRREPGENLIEQWLHARPDRRLVTSKDELGAVGRTEQILGLFSKSHMTYVALRAKVTHEPTLAQMMAAALDRLASHPEGFYLLVEGGRIDHGHHDGRPGYALLETQALSEAIEVALSKVDLNETLILVTADHSHSFVITGYPTRGNPILGHVVGNDAQGQPNKAPVLAADGHPYTTLGYLNGPGAVSGERRTPDTGIHAVAQSLIPLSFLQADGTYSNSEQHGGEDVALYGIGVGSERVSGVIEQSEIFGIMTAAFGWDPE